MPTASLLFPNATQISSSLGGVSGLAVGASSNSYLDLAVAYAGATSAVQILRGNYASGFSLGPLVTPAATPLALTTGNAGNDAYTPDLFVTYQGGDNTGFQILTNNGAGVFTAQNPTTATGGSQFIGTDTRINIAVGNIFASSGAADVVLGDPGNQRVRLYQNSGSGSYTSAATYLSGTIPTAVALADLDSINNADLIATDAATGRISVSLNNGTGGFAAPTYYTVGSSPAALAAVDLDGSKGIDLVVANRSSNSISVLMNNGSGGFTDGGSYAVGSAPNAIAIGDLDGDGRKDIVIANSGSNSLSVLFGQSTGFSSAQTISLPSPITSATAVALGDFTGDGRADIAVGTDNGVYFLTNVLTPTITGISPDTGSSGSDRITSGVSGLLTITGNGASGDYVQLYDNGNSVGSATSISGGIWTINSLGLGDGTHSLTAKDTTTQATSAAFTVVVDTVGATVLSSALTTSAGGSVTAGSNVVAGTTLVYSGTTEAGANVQLYDGGELMGSVPPVTADGSGKFSFTINTSSLSGDHSFAALPVDLAGNPSTFGGAIPVTLSDGNPTGSFSGAVSFAGSATSSLDLSSATFTGVTSLGLPTLAQATLTPSQLLQVGGGLTLGGAVGRLSVSGPADSAIDLTNVVGLSNLAVLDLGNSSGTQSVTIGPNGPAKLVSNAAGNVNVTVATANIQLFGGTNADSFTGSASGQVFVASLGGGAITATGNNAQLFLSDPLYATQAGYAAAGQQVTTTGSNDLIVGRRVYDQTNPSFSVVPSAIDMVNLLGSGSADTILAADGAMNVNIGGTGGNHLLIGGTANFTVQDSSLTGNDTIYGGSGAINLAYLGNLGSGGNGSGDTVIAGNGALTVITSSYVGSTIYAGAGADIVAISKATTLPSSNVVDVVVGFQAGVDKLDLTALSIATADQFAAIQRTTYANGIGLKFSANQEIRLIGVSNISLADVHLGAVSVSPP